MIKITDKQLCCGCGACQQKCPKQCISLIQDNEGFSYPMIDQSICIDCGLCESVCHELHPYGKRKPLSVIAANNKNTAVRLSSSSGGIFTLLAERTINKGGVVFGARFDGNWQVILDYTETIEGLDSFRGSKYVQANTQITYRQAEKFLKEGRNVLFSGSPCQIAGLLHYLRKDYPNLLTVDFVCHGVPSPRVWRIYLNEISEAGCKAISNVEFRNKDNGWKLFNFKLEYNKQDQNFTISSCHQDNHYMKAFLRNMILRPSCHKCKAKYGSSHSDITIADFWGVAETLPQMDDNKGTGLVLLNTVKGISYFPYGEVDYMESSLEAATKNNPGLNHIATPHPNRKEFFDNLCDDKSVVELINLELPVLSRFSPKGIAKNLIKRYKILTINKIRWGRRVNIKGINYRNKDTGWTSYRLQIELDKICESEY